MSNQEPNLQERLCGIVAFLPGFEAKDPQALSSFVQAAYKLGWVRTDIDWPKWKGTEEAKSLANDPAAMQKATAEQLAHVLTTVIRQDRFIEGSLESLYESGYLTMLLRRAKELSGGSSPQKKDSIYQQSPRILLRALSYELVDAWKKAFSGIDAVEASQGSILTITGDAIVSPANSFGYMDGSLDLIYSQHFGWGVEEALRAKLLAEYDGELPVGQAVIVPTGNAEIPFLISAPTMRVPMKIAETVNAYLAFRAVLRCVREYNKSAPKPIESILCPGLGTGEGRMPVERCANQMRAAYDAIILGKIETKGGLARAVEGHISLMR